MPAKLHFTPEQDQTLIRMRAAGASWPEIGAAIGMSSNAAAERGRKFGAAIREERAIEADEESSDGDREPLPPGHPETWSLLVSGTVLADSPFRSG